MPRKRENFELCGFRDQKVLQQIGFLDFVVLDTKNKVLEMYVAT